MDTKIWYALAVVALILVLLVVAWQFVPLRAEITSFEECERAGFPVMESYPRQCAVPGEGTFVEDIGNAIDKLDIIRLDNPRPNQTVESPLLIEGAARGQWYWEASFPVFIYDEDENLLGMTPAQAQGEWMTTEFVSFRARLEFNPPSTRRGWLVLERDNPSGLPEHHEWLRVPISFE